MPSHQQASELCDHLFDRSYGDCGLGTDISLLVFLYSYLQDNYSSVQSLNLVDLHYEMGRFFDSFKKKISHHLPSYSSYLSGRASVRRYRISLILGVLNSYDSAISQLSRPVLNRDWTQVTISDHIQSRMTDDLYRYLQDNPTIVSK